ncbi:MAG: hypothetical protein H6661_13555 [Ardenticatenaceae bacterium]|nr:hypothetical protein [Ardenticatenaceae bacterium]
MPAPDNLLSMEVLTYDGEGDEVGPTSPEMLEAIIAEGTRGDGRRLRAPGQIPHASLMNGIPISAARKPDTKNLDEFIPVMASTWRRPWLETESTCVIILEITVHLPPLIPARSLLVVPAIPTSTRRATTPSSANTAHRPEGDGQPVGRISIRQKMHPEELAAARG